MVMLFTVCFYFLIKWFLVTAVAHPAWKEVCRLFFGLSNERCCDLTVEKTVGFNLVGKAHPAFVAWFDVEK
jgi:hypothetical protein